MIKVERDRAIAQSSSQTVTEMSSLESINGSALPRRSSAVQQGVETMPAMTTTKVAVHDLNRIEQIKRIRMLRSVLKDCKQVKKEYQKVNTYLETKRFSGEETALISKVKSMIEHPQDITSFEKLQGTQKSIEDLISFDINKLQGGSMAFQKEMDFERN